MQYRKLDKLGLEVSLLGVGCMRFPTTKTGEIDEEKTITLIDEAMKAGINYYDTAWMYHGIGKSESFVGKILKRYPRESYYLADKFPIWEVETEEEIDQIFQTQLDRLQEQCIDFYLVHSLNKDHWEKAKKLNLMKHIEKFKAQGRIKYIGFSFHDEYDVFERILNDYPHWQFCQIQLNYMDTHHQQGIAGYELLAKKEIPCFIMEPLKGGALSNLPDDVKQPFTMLHDNWTCSSWGLRYVANLANVNLILSGMTTLEHLQDNVQTLSVAKTLTDDEVLAINQVSQNIRERTKVGCTGCNYCMPCPAGVNIPANFTTLNEFYMYGESGGARWQYGLLKNEQKDASQCVACKKCEQHCPQKIKIIQELKQVRETLDAKVAN